MIKRKKSPADIAFDIFNYTLMALLVFICIYPLWYVFIGSFSNADAVTNGEVMLWFKGFNLAGYKKAFQTPYLGVSYLNTIFYAIVGTLISLVLTVLGAYPLSKKRLRGRKVINFFVVFTMWFNAGVMPTYILYSNLGILDTRLGVLLHHAVSVFYVIIMRSAFEGVPDSLEESMHVDGANDFQILVKCYLPLVVPTLMTLGLYYFVLRWNAYFWPMIMLKTETLVPLSVVLRKLVVEMSGLFENMESMDISTLSKETIVYSTIVISVVPMLVLYPFIQKFFVKGVTLGAVKG